jgi:hypothetical protein
MALDFLQKARQAGSCACQPLESKTREHLRERLFQTESSLISSSDGETDTQREEVASFSIKVQPSISHRGDNLGKMNKLLR